MFWNIQTSCQLLCYRRRCETLVAPMNSYGQFSPNASERQFGGLGKSDIERHGAGCSRWIGDGNERRRGVHITRLGLHWTPLERSIREPNRGRQLAVVLCKCSLHPPSHAADATVIRRVFGRRGASRMTINAPVMERLGHR